MKTTVLVVWLVLVLSIAVSAQSSGPLANRSAATYFQLPLSFEPNRGQTDARVDFLSHGSGYTLLLMPTEALLSLRPSEPNAAEPGTVRMRLAGANPHPKVTGLDEQPGQVNYFLGNDPRKWRTGIPTYAKVSYQNVYPGVDLVYYGNQRRLEYDFVVSAGADPTEISFDFAGAIPHIEANGDLILPVAGGEVRFPKPVVYQIETGSLASPRQHAVTAQYVVRGNHVAFAVSDYDHSKGLVIDPTVLLYSTYLGGSNFDGAFAVTVDSSGNAYVTGGTVSNPFPVSGSGVVQNFFGGAQIPCIAEPVFECGDVFITKMNPTGSAFVWSTYLGGSSREVGLRIAIDSASNVYVAGVTASTNFPVLLGAYQTRFAGQQDGFVAEVKSDGSRLLYSTYFGGHKQDEILGMAVDSSGKVYVTGNTNSTDFPITSGVIQSTCNGCPAFADAFVAEFNPSLTGSSSLLYSTYLGGSAGNGGRGIAVDSSGNAYVAGETTSTDFNLMNPIQSSYGGGGTTCSTLFRYVCGDAFVTKLNSTATALIYSTYLGGSGEDSANGIALDAAGNAFVAGGTDSSDFPITLGVVQPTFAGGASGCVSAGIACGDAFVTKINAAGNAWLYSTFLGGTLDDIALLGEAVDSSDNVHISGLTDAQTFPTTSGAAQVNYGGGTTTCSPGLFCGDGFVATLNVTGSALVYSSFLGGSGDDAGFGLALDSSGNNFVVGATTSSNFPITSGVFQPTCGTDAKCNGASDAFITKSPAVAPKASFAPPSLTFSGVVGTTSTSQAITLTNTGNGGMTVSSISASGNYSQTNTCPTTLNASANCIITVTFTPTVIGAIPGEITVNDSAATATQVVNLSGTGNAPLSFSPTTLSFGTITVGQTSAAKIVTVTNNQTTTLSFSFSASGNYSAVAGGPTPCGASLAAGASCTISVTFSPTANGSISGVVPFTYTGIFTPLEVPLLGTGTGGGTAPLTFTPTSLSFGSQVVGKTSPAKTVTVKNSSTSSLTISSFSSKPGGNYKITGGTCKANLVLAAGAVCTWTVTFIPSINGTITGSILITDTAVISKQVLSISGTAVLPVSFDQNSLTFPPQAVGTLSVAQTVTLTNNQATTTLTINSLVGSGDYIVAPGGTTPCGSTVAGKGTCTFTVTFAPTAKGVINGAATIAHNAADSPQVVSLTGTGQ